MSKSFSNSISMGTNRFTSNNLSKKIEKIVLTFEDKVLKRSKKNATFNRTYFPWVRIDEIKKDLAKHNFANIIMWDQLRLFCKNIELENNMRFFDYNVEVESSIIIQKVQSITTLENGVINPYQIFQEIPKQINQLILAVQSGLNAGRKPKLSEDGTSGTYFLQNHEKKKIAIFKPYDQEPFTPSNPRGYIGNLGGNGIRKGILSGQCATRQVAAYLLDKTGYHTVPATTYVEFFHPSFNYKEIIKEVPIVSGTQTDLKTKKTKHGSLQQFVESQDVAGNLGSHQFDVQEVHKIGILDLRILNCDRNEANILVKKVSVMEKNTKQQYKKIFMTPIDHGLSFPDNFQIYEYQMVWMNYPQAKRPFSKKALDFIANIKPDEDCRLLRQKLGFRQICLRNFKIAEIFLKKMAAAGFNLYEIGSKVYRMDDDSDESDYDDEKSEKSSPIKKDMNKSQLEKLIQRTEQIYNLVKQNGIRSTVQFQIGLIKMRKQKQDESLTFLEQKQIESQKQLEEKSIKQKLKKSFKEQHYDLPEIKQLVKKQSERSTKELTLSPSPQMPNLKHTASISGQKNQVKVKETSLERMGENTLKKSAPKVRNVSLPHLKKKNDKYKTKKKKVHPNPKHRNNNGWKKNQKWEQIFFHYFEDLLDQYIKKLKAKPKPAKPPMGRARLMSQNIQL